MIEYNGEGRENEVPTRFWLLVFWSVSKTQTSYSKFFTSTFLSDMHSLYSKLNIAPLRVCIVHSVIFFLESSILYSYLCPVMHILGFHYHFYTSLWSLVLNSMFSCEIANMIHVVVDLDQRTFCRVGNIPYTKPNPIWTSLQVNIDMNSFVEL